MAKTTRRTAMTGAAALAAAGITRSAMAADETVKIPFFGRQIRIDVRFDDVIDGAFAVADDLGFELTSFQHTTSLGINSFALVVHHFVILEYLFSTFEMVFFYLLLCTLNHL